MHEIEIDKIYWLGIIKFDCLFFFVILIRLELLVKKLQIKYHPQEKGEDINYMMLRILATVALNSNTFETSHKPKYLKGIANRIGADN